MGDSAASDESYPDSDRPDSAVPEQGFIRVIDATDLFQGSKTVQICHGDELYTLRQTRPGKLILNK